MNKKWLVPIIVIALINPIFYVIYSVLPPEGYEFTGGIGREDGIFLSFIQSAQNNLESPWMNAEEGLVISKPIAGLYSFLFLGLFAGFVDAVVLFVAAKFLFFVVYLVVVYFFLSYFIKDKKEFNIVYFIFLLTSGFGVYVLYALLSIFAGTPVAGSVTAISYDLISTGLTTTSLNALLYYTLPLALGYIGFLFFMKRKNILATSLLFGLTSLFYANYALSFLVLIVIYSIFRNELRSRLTDIIKILFVSMLFLIPYALTYSSLSSIKESFFGPALIFSIILGGGIPILIALHKIYSRLLVDNKKPILLIWVAAILLFSFAQLSEAVVLGNADVSNYLQSSIVNVFYSFSFLFKLPLFVIIAWTTLVIFAGRSSIYDFFAVWLLITLLLSIVPSQLAFWYPFRFVHFLWIPIAVLAGKGILEFSKKYSIDYKKILLVIFIISIPSLLYLPYLNASLLTDNRYPTFYTTDEMDALRFLKTQEQGLVLASEEIGTYLPIISGKKTVLTMERVTQYYDEEDRDAVYNFYKNPNEATIKRYNVKYVFFGYKESEISHENMLDKSGLLEEIYNKGSVYIYRVV